MNSLTSRLALAFGACALHTRSESRTHGRIRGRRRGALVCCGIQRYAIDAIGPVHDADSGQLKARKLRGAGISAVEEADAGHAATGRERQLPWRGPCVCIVEAGHGLINCPVRDLKQRRFDCHGDLVALGEAHRRRHHRPRDVVVLEGRGHSAVSARQRVRLHRCGHAEPTARSQALRRVAWRRDLGIDRTVGQSCGERHLKRCDRDFRGDGYPLVQKADSAHGGGKDQSLPHGAGDGCGEGDVVHRCRGVGCTFRIGPLRARGTFCRDAARRPAHGARSCHDAHRARRREDTRGGRARGCRRNESCEVRIRRDRSAQPPGAACRCAEDDGVVNARGRKRIRGVAAASSQ
mmetsp:Transcript_45565/g.140469  ORF Transcript_45565/g.140469 Transcript_45565/m.140469 type:complete len:350 (-) Transcript_45565:547-1596(-)